MGSKSIIILLCVCLHVQHAYCFIDKAEAFFKMGMGKFTNVKHDIFMDVSSHCGKTYTSDEAEDGFIYSHTGKMISLFGLDLTSYGDNTECVVTLDVSGLGTDWKIRLQPINQVDLAGSAGDCDILAVFGIAYDVNTLQNPLISYCGNENALVGAGIDPSLGILSPGPVLSVKFVSNNDGAVSKGFKLLYSIVRPDSDTCSTDTEFKCDNNTCIPTDFKCDGVTQCMDKTDETEAAAGCSMVDRILGHVLGLGFYTVLAIVGLVVLIICISCGCICYCCCCKKKKKRRRRRRRGDA